MRMGRDSCIIDDFVVFCLIQVKNRTLKPMKKVDVQKISSNSEFVDDDDALNQVTFSRFINKYCYFWFWDRILDEIRMSIVVEMVNQNQLGT